MEEIVIIIDDRELKTKTAKKLFELGARLEPRRLETADFILSERVGIERKRVGDFVNSLLDRRLFKQARKLKEEFETPILLIEGIESMYSQRNVHQNAIRGALASILVDFKIPIIKTTNEEDTARTIFAIAKREQTALGKHPIAIRKKKPQTPREQQEFIVSGLPGVGPELAKRILKTMGSLREVFLSGEEMFNKIDGLGKKKTKEITELIKKPYET